MGSDLSMPLTRNLELAVTAAVCLKSATACVANASKATYSLPGRKVIPITQRETAKGR